MENSKAKNVIIVGLTVITSLLLACVIYMSVTGNTIQQLFLPKNTISDNKQDEKEEVKQDDKDTENVNNGNTTTGNNTNTTTDPYANYKDKKWSRTTSIDSSAWGLKASIVEVSGVKKVKVQLINMETSKVSKQWYASEIAGTPKYIARTLSCAGHRAIAVVTTEGNAYILTSAGEGEAPTYKQEFVKLQFSEKVLEILVTKDIVATSCSTEQFYFLTENGKLVNEEEMTWEEKNPYVDVVGYLERPIYVYADKTIAYEADGVLTKLKYNGSNVKISKFFMVDISDSEYSEEFYFMDSSNNLLVLNDNNELELYKSGVESISYNGYDMKAAVIHKITIIYSDGSTEIFKNADLRNGNYTEIFK